MYGHVSQRGDDGMNMGDLIKAVAAEADVT